MDRRTFIGAVGAAGIIGGIAVSTSAAAGTSRVAVPGGREDRRVHRKLDRALRRRDAAEERLTRRLGDAPMPSDLRRSYIRATAAMAGVEALSRLKPREQVHAHAQQVIQDLVRDVAQGAHAVRELLAGVDLAPLDRHEALNGLFAEAEHLLAQDADPSEASRRLTLGTSRELKAEIEDEGLVRVGHRASKKLERIAALSERISEARRGVGLIECKDPELVAELERGRAFWGELAAPRMSRGAEDALLILGILAAGLAVLAAGYVVFVTAVCALACEAPGLLVISVLGVVLIVALAAGIVAMVRRLRGDRPRNRPRERHRRPATPTPSDPSLAAAEICRTHRVPMPGPRCDRITVAVAGAYGRGMPREVVREQASRLPSVDLLPVVLNRLDPARAWGPTPALDETLRIYRRKNWPYPVTAFEGDLRAIEDALGTGRSMSDVRLASDLAREPGQIQRILETSR